MAFRQPRWIYWKEIFRTKFQANCQKTKIEDNWIGGYEIGPSVEIRKLKSDKYIIRYTYDE
ncbi:hypothetical protein [Salisediminibacterium halotolerans]|uniref:Uncharacterized protein n=1 Tax=Salisediminibacterium halotolerans TaxID=517425 RepID=A0A1H9WHX8_9BACI|nr:MULTISPECIES: hypothetical protein [Salisediminibacterium]RLJ74384.1 hypothetical protein BCL39_1672 [Actinophytocola xinjiangensis]RPE87523.1 hypothetical protein EDD67_1259 [Salisediminibacterium halotolerans]TWG35221.1 hypothetical protein BCL52_1669 [Salisediminibacterium halotolerans]SES33287.1 hypothetical protein SAMN05444126_13523 [Salisediminibacterium haloalkalitolerans]GEL08148.1 hypothetical protein SHA02_15640 [Salisediminibacterium halotolerans]